MTRECTDCNFTWGGFFVEVVRISDEYIRAPIPMHSHAADSLELHCILSGSGKVATEAGEHPLAAGDFFLTAGGAAHEQNSDEGNPVRELCLYAFFRKTGKAQPPAKALFSSPFYLGKADEALLAAQSRAAEELSRLLPDCEDALSCLAKFMLVCIARLERARGEGLPPKGAFSQGDIFLRIEEAFLYEYRTLTLTALAERVGMSARQLQRLLSAHYGKTFREKKAEARMRVANLLLGEGELSVSRIAEETGYNSLEHFCAEYKKRFGCTASEHKKQSKLSSIRKK